ncbi:RHS repeat-associated core domain-containing protein [Streptomyces sp. NPDC051582]|uniref:RHS repeat-associated core domain-containing protein n=1 Tax=Streptomyces sp. NPDC051582 TaxID=3155167 RepID=UPI00343065F4
MSFDDGGRVTERRDRQQRKTTYRYEAGRLMSVTTDTGRSARFEYSGNQLTGVTFPDGSKVAYEFTAGRMTAFVDSAGKRVGYAYDGQGRLSSVTDKSGRVAVQNSYDSSGRVAEQSASAMTGKVKFTYNGAATDVTMPDGGIWTDVHWNNSLLAQYDPFGNRTSFEYGFHLDPIALTDALGRRFETHFDIKGRPVAYEGPITSKSVTYGPQGELRSAFDGNGNSLSFDIDSNRRLTTAYDGRRAWTQYTYNSASLLEKIKTTEGRETSFGYDANGSQTSITLPGGQRETRTFDLAGRVRTVTDPRGNLPAVSPPDFTTTYEYDAAGRLTGVIDPKGRLTRRKYDDAGNLLSVTNASGQVTSYAYDAAGRVTSTQDPAGNQTAITYNSMGQISSRVNADGGKYTYAYDKAGRLIQMITPRGNVSGGNPASFSWSYGYDKVGNQTSATDPAGKTTTTTYDAENRPVSVTDPLGRVTKKKYDGVGNLVETSDALGKVTYYTFDAANNLTAVKDPNGNTLSYTYDWDGNRTSESTPLGFKTTYGYDVSGRQTSRTDPRGNAVGADPSQYTWRSTYDAVGNLIGETDPLGNKTAKVYDALNNLVEQTDPQGNKASYGYDALNRLVQTTAADGGVTKATFDASGNLATRIDANGHINTYEYDKNGHRTKATDALNRTSQYEYDPDGNRTKVTNARGQTITSTFDSRNLLTSTGFSDGTPKVSYTYDDAGQPITIADGSGIRTLTYDSAGRPLSIGQPGAGDPFKYTYRADGSVSSRTYPNGYTTSYTYDADGRMTGQTAGGKTTTYSWDEAGNLLTTNLPTTPAVTEARSYDRSGRLASMTEAAGTRQFVRDGSGRVTSESFKDATTAGFPKRYDYDAAGRLTRACTDTSVLISCLPGTTGERYSFDKVGNRLTSASDRTLTVTNVFDAADQLISTTTGTSVANQSYDADGNLTKDSAGTYSYDALGRTKSKDIGADTYTYIRDADGNPIKTKKNGMPLRAQSWDLNNRIPRLATDFDTLRPGGPENYQYGPSGEPQAVNAQDSTFYYLHDRQNSVTSVRDLAGVENAKYTYETWGNPVSATSGGSQQGSEFGFTGAFKDPASQGRIQLPARDYDTKSGRFTSPDPRPETASAANSSTYAYANNDPVNQSDPTGACPLCVSAAVGAVTGAVVEGAVYSWQHRNSGFTASGLAKSAGRGAVVGGLAGLLMPGAGSLAARAAGLAGGRGFAASAMVNAGVGAGFSYAINSEPCRPTDPWDLLAGAVGGAGSGLVGPAFSWLRGLLQPTGTVSAHSSSLAFRALREGEGPSASLVRPGARADMQPWQHIADGTNSPWISLTRDPKVMIGIYGEGSATAGRGAHGYIAVDLSKVDSEIVHAWDHVSVPPHVRELYGIDVAKTAFRDREVLAKWRLPAEAIVHYWPAGTSLQQMLRDLGQG